jgi:hypothetical protein
MSSRSGATLAALLLMTLGTFGATSQYAPAPDDGPVLGAVLAHTIVPTHRRTHGDGAAPVEVQGTSAPLCPGRSGNAAVCRIPDGWHRFLRPDASRRWPGLIHNERTLQDLVVSLEARNAEAHTLPLSNVPGVSVVEQSAGYARSPDGPTRWGTAKLSLPGYSEDGYALVYGSYACGSLCGYGWLFVVKKVDGHWRVESATVTVIS